MNGHQKLEEGIRLFNNRLENRDNIFQAGAIMKELAENGNNTAKYYIYKIAATQMFRFPIDLDEAMKNLTESAESGLAEACIELGNVYLYGKNAMKSLIFSEEPKKILPDFDVALKWYKKAADLGSIAGLYYYAVACLGRKSHEKEGVVALKKCADNNHLPAIINYASRLKKGYDGEIDLKKSFEYYQKAVALGDKRAMYELGLFYENGDVVAKDLHKALELFEKSETAGGTFHIGLFYEKGLIFKKDLYKAVEYFYKSEEIKDFTSPDTFGKFIEYGSGEDMDKLVALREYQRNNNI